MKFSGTPIRPDFIAQIAFKSFIFFELKSELRSILSSLKTESEAQVQFVIDSCCLVSQSNHLKHSSKRCDWLKFACFIYGLETGVSVLFTNTRTRWPHNEREIFNTARGVAECSIENFAFIVLPASACICKQNTN